VLLGFPDPATEGCYLDHMSLRKLRQWDALGALLGCSMAVASLRNLPLLRGTAAGRPSSEELTVLAAFFFFQLPWLAMLTRRRWYLSNRERLLVWLGGAGRVVVALGHGLQSVLTGQDHCTMPQNCALVLLACTVNQPLIQQVRFRKVAPLVMIDAGNVGCYWAFRSGSAAVGLAGGLAALVSGLAVAAAVDGRCRAAFVHQSFSKARKAC
jgi:hypothetical protein